MKAYFLALICLLSTKVFAQQKISITGKVIDEKNNLPIEYAGIILSEKVDSTKKLGVVSNRAGEFVIKEVANGIYKIKISVVGYNTISKELIVSDKVLQLGVLQMKEDAIALKDVAISGRYSTATVKKDTLEFNADAYKTRPNAAVEDLLKKLPGVTIDQDGSILVQGQKVTRLTGKIFLAQIRKQQLKIYQPTPSQKCN